MKIKTIHIMNYRKIIDAKINLEDNITIIAGANNSGKTSLVELFNAVFGNQRRGLCGDDIPVMERQIWSDQAYSLFHAAFNSGKEKEEVIEEICTLMESTEKPEDAILIPPISLKVQVDYDEDRDDIRYFADYIMELSPTNTSFYFIYKYSVNQKAFRKVIDIAYEKLHARFQKLTGVEDKDKDAIRAIKEMLVNLYARACGETAWFSDRTYTNVVPMEVTAFKDLFNYRHIVAVRVLDDESSDRTGLLSRNMIDIAEQEDDWKDFVHNLPDQIVQPIQAAQIQEKVRKVSVESLNGAMSEIAKTNGGQTGNIVIDMDVTEDAIQTLLKNITCAKYQMDDVYLSESSQGLGYSNLIYIHLQLEKYKKTIDPMIVNFFVIEEPESHMHPQMQNVFAQYLFDYYKGEDGMQGMLTTHSHEVVRTFSIPQLRVLRQTSSFRCNLFDLHEFYDGLKTDKNLLEFYDWFYAINFPDIVFADKIILYEGDTERMLIKRVLQSDEFKTLRNQYISFVQVGGAYAYKYQSIIDFLGMKSVLITDLDFDKDVSTEEDVLASCSTNCTINIFAENILSEPHPTVKTLYDWKADSGQIVINDTICLAFQGKKDGFSRTLEEAMLAKRYKMSSLENIEQSEWKNRRKNDNLKFVIPRTKECNIHSIVLHTSNAKTDFMYSVIMSDLEQDMLPDYIKEALLWLT